MNYNNTSLSEVYELTPDVFKDERGLFFESFNDFKFRQFLEKINIKTKIEFVQDNYSESKYGVLRGLHFQKKPHAQAKLIRVLNGEIFDVVVNINKNSNEFGKYYCTILSSENKKMLWIPEGFAHGFLTLKKETKVLYKTSKFYKPSSEVTINWDDNDLNINWPLKHKIIIGKKDKNGIQLRQIR